jgi:NAD(P)-dependent dehydrogenase (short-subunit alcohol dehydrogenase family)
VIFTASGLHQGTIHFSDLGFKRRFSGFNAYRQSKLGIILITRLLAIKPEHAGIGFYCVHPGMVKTAIGRNASWFSQLIFKWLGQSKENGAKTHLHLIGHPTSELTSGGYYARANLSKSSSASYDMNCGEKLLHVLNEYSVIQSRGVTHES